MMLIGADRFLSLVNLRRFLSVTGWKGAGKDFLTQELVEYYLNRRSRRTGEYYKLITNQVCVWGDPLRAVDGSFINVMGSVFWLAEAGMYLRMMKEFRHPYSLARKFDDYFFFPSIELPHAVLTSFVVEPILELQSMLGLWYNPVWAWTVEGGHGRTYGGWFLWFADASKIGVYDDEDPSENTEACWSAFEATIEQEQRRRGRNGLQAMAGGEDELDMGAQQQIASLYQEISLSLSEDNKRSRSK